MIHLSPLHLLLSALACILLYRYSYYYEEPKIYIVIMGDLPAEAMEAAESLHLTMVEKVLGSKRAQQHLLYSYKGSLNGFVASLTQKEAKRMTEMDGVLSVLPDERVELHTTRSWDFIGFPENVNRSSFESDVIVGVVDTGIWPESQSFDDQGIGPVPSRWRGECQNMTCNRKLIGAKYFRNRREFGIGADETLSPRDSNGHGSHCASIAAGRLVGSTNVSGFGNGTARGGVPSSRIAAYKVLWSHGGGNSTANTLAGLIEAINDGVDIISVSLGRGKGHPKPYYKDIYAIASFRAMRKGILTSKSAGNNGPKPSSMDELAPWLVSVAASSIDRKFLTTTRLGNNLEYQGISLNTFDLQGKMYPLIYAGDAPNVTGGFNSSVSKYCYESYCLDANLVKGKILLCEWFGNQLEQIRSGAVGVIHKVSASRKDSSDIYALPAIDLSQRNGSYVHDYIKSTRTPIATIFKSNQVNDPSAPFIGTSSSRGPNSITPDILKPDIAAPGVDILAAWSLENPISGVQGDSRFANYNIISGTSMAAPHVTAIAAYVKSFHPLWSPAAIKSALMTTASQMSSRLNPEAEFAYGAGQLNPTRAVSPGLVYNITKSDYEKFLCGQKYKKAQIETITGYYVDCNQTGSITAWNLNLPSFALKIKKRRVGCVFKRKVTNVGDAISTYKAKLFINNNSSSLGLRYILRPKALSFSSVGEKKSFTLTIKGTIKGSTDKILESVTLLWYNAKYRVRSPIVVYS